MMFMNEMRKSINNDMEFDESVIEDESSLDGTAVSNNVFPTQVTQDINASPDTTGLVLQMFAFVDAKSHKLFNLRQFTNLLKSYPRTVAINKVTPSAHGDKFGPHVEVFHHPRINLGVERIVAAGLGHSANTFNQAYGVDPRFADSPQLQFSEMQAACPIFHKAIGVAAVKTVMPELPSEEIPMPLDNYDLIEAGKKYFNVTDFEYKSKQQGEFTTMVLPGNDRKVAGLQAPTAFGKSLVFTLPMMVLKKHKQLHYVSFVCVPYESLKLATIKKLEKGGLQVEDIGLFSRGGEMVHSVDVFVGCLESFTDGNLGHIFKNWEMIHGQETKLGYMVFDEAHTLFMESRFRKSVNNIVNLSWEKWKKTLFLSATMDESLFKRILKDRHISDPLQKTSLYVNTINKVPEVDVEVEVKLLECADISTQATRLVDNFINNTTNSKAVFFFSSKEALHKVYKSVSRYAAVARVDANILESEKRKVFDDFEDEHSQTRVVMGTKLLSNGLDCKSVQFICLVDCFIDCVDYLQMVGRIRHWGYVKVLTDRGKKWFPTDTELRRRFPTLDWRKCVSESVSKFYHVPYKGHNGCCNVVKNDERIRVLKQKLDDDANQGLPRQVEGPTAVEAGDGGPPLNVMTRKVRGLLLIPGSDLLMKDWRNVLGQFNWKSTKVLLANIEPRNIVTWDDTVSSNICADCLMPLHGVDECGVTAKVVGGLLYELLAILKIVEDGVNYTSTLNQLPRIGATLLLIRILERLKDNVRKSFIKMNKALVTYPEKAADKDGLALNPCETFKKYFGLISSRHINVMLLLFKGDVDHSPTLFSNMSNYYSAVFRNKMSIEKIANNNDGAIFAIYKMHTLADLESWYSFQYQTADRKKLVEGFIGNTIKVPVVVTMIWAMYESRIYKEVFHKYISVDYFKHATTFPVFVKYMCSTVDYREKRVPLYVVILGVILGNIPSLQISYNYFNRASGPEGPSL